MWKFSTQAINYIVLKKKKNKTFTKEIKEIRYFNFIMRNPLCLVLDVVLSTNISKKFIKKKHIF